MIEPYFTLLVLIMARGGLHAFACIERANRPGDKVHGSDPVLTAHNMDYPPKR